VRKMLCRFRNSPRRGLPARVKWNPPSKGKEVVALQW
jgi:hypothetical protein